MLSATMKFAFKMPRTACLRRKRFRSRLRWLDKKQEKRVTLSRVAAVLGLNYERGFRTEPGPAAVFSLPYRLAEGSWPHALLEIRRRSKSRFAFAHVDRESYFIFIFLTA